MTTNMILKKVFPVPPPTSNDLTPTQRTQLLKKAKKIEQLLGTTPYLVDIETKDALDPIEICLPSNRSSFDGRSSLDSLPSTSSSASVKRSFSTTSVGGRRRVLQHSSKRSLSSAFDGEKVPLLELSMSSLTLSLPSGNRTSFAESQRSSYESADDSPRAESVRNTSVQSPRSSLILDKNFIIPTPNSMRKQKMDRLRKKLGGDVPYHLVFPRSSCADEPPDPEVICVNSPAPVVTDRLSAPLPPLPSLRARRHAGPRIARTRDSIVDGASIHRARRQVRVAGHDSPRSAMGGAETLVSMDIRRGKHRLSFIIENPDEHNAGIRNEFGLHVSRVSSDDGADVVTEWFGTNFSVWTGAAGCEKRPEAKKRPSSYRKPVPSLPIDCL